jgi:hypothetical protein
VCRHYAQSASNWFALFRIELYFDKLACGQLRDPALDGRRGILITAQGQDKLNGHQEHQRNFKHDEPR